MTKVKYFRLKHKKTGLYLHSINYNRTKPSIRYYKKHYGFWNSDILKKTIERIIDQNLKSELENLILESYKIEEISEPCKDLSYYCNAVKRDLVFRKIKGGHEI